MASAISSEQLGSSLQMTVVDRIQTTLMYGG